MPEPMSAEDFAAIVLRGQWTYWDLVAAIRRRDEDIRRARYLVDRLMAIQPTRI